MSSLVNNLPVLTALQNVPFMINQNAFSECSSQKKEPELDYVVYLQNNSDILNPSASNESNVCTESNPKGMF